MGTPLKEAHIAQMSELVRQQTDEWSRLKCNQMNETHTLILAFMDSRRDLLLKVLSEFLFFFTSLSSNYFHYYYYYYYYRTFFL